MAKHYTRTEKNLLRNVNYTKLFAKPIRILRTKEETRWTSLSSETTSPYPRKQNNSLCKSGQCTKNKSRLPAGKTACDSPYASKGFLTHSQMDLMDLRNLPCTCSCHRKHNWILHMIDHFTKYSWLYPLKKKQVGDVLECLSQYCW